MLRVAFSGIEPADLMAKPNRSDDMPVIVKKYTNRRLYNTANSSYVSLDYLCQMVKDGVKFVVNDAKTGKDITQSVLTQIIVEEEAKGHSLLPIDFLRQLIGFSGDNAQQKLLPQYLDHTMNMFAHNQEQMQDYLRDSFSGTLTIGQLEELGRQNMAMFEKTMQVFSPFGHGAKTVMLPEAKEGATDQDQIDALERKLEALQAQIEAITRK